MIKIKIKDIATMAQALINIVDYEGSDYGEEEALDIAHKVIDATTDDYEKGYQKALEAILSEKFTITQGGETIEVIDVNTVHGLGLAHRENEMNLEREIQI